MIAALAIVRAAHFTSLMIAFGAESFAGLCRVSGSDTKLPKNVVGLCAALALATAAALLLLTTAQMAGTGFAVDKATLTLVLEQTLFGKTAMLRIALLAALTGATFTSAPMPVRISLGGAALAAAAVTSHAAAGGTAATFDLRTANDAVHLLAAGFWVGGLAVLTRLVIRHAHESDALLPPLRVFSRWGMIAVALLVIAGSINAYIVLFSAGGAWSFPYIALLAAKLVLAGIMVALALANRYGLVPAFARGEPDARETLVMSVIAELALGLIIVAIVGLLGLLPPRM